MNEGKGRLNEERYTQESREIMDTDTKGAILNVKKGSTIRRTNLVGTSVEGNWRRRRRL